MSRCICSQCLRRWPARCETRCIHPAPKDDPPDADLLLDLLLQHRDKLRRLSPDTEATRRVQNLVEERRKLVDEKTEQINRLTSHLKIYFPQMLDWFDRLDRETACALLERWPVLQELQKVPPAKLQTFFRKHHCRDQEVIERRIVGIRQAVPAIRDRAVIEAKSTVVKVIAQLIRILVQGIAELDRKIEEETAAHPDFFIFDSLPGAGPALAPRLLWAFDSQRARYGSAQEVQAYSGIAPVIERSGKKEVDTFPLGGPEVSATKLPRVGWALDYAVAVGTRLLRATTPTGQGAPCRSAGTGIQMDPYRIPLLAKWRCL